MNEPLLTVSGLTVRYGGVVALDDVSLRVPKGAIVGLIGPNGAGKTTMVDALTGFARYTGEVRFAGTRLDGLPAHRRAARGLARTFQSAGIFDDLTVEENILIGERSAARRFSTLRAIFGGRTEKPRAQTRRIIDLLDLGGSLEVPAGELSEGHRKLVSVAQALAGGPQLVLFDEPAAGLDSTESAWLGRQLRAVSESGVTILLVDHDMELVTSVCDELVVLDFGKVIAAGPPRQVLDDPGVVAAYLGSVTTAGDA
ncbi:ABC transporter ATP-binding protein [Amycolatopsis sp.]|uniref:ABC transporter ATP-binding protein n=1 Tax=Amycolatopsis sp. TaxID=37632 RepID=UPI002BC3C350|nr:ABC transporter ATP-binding protein [Amycolatopsis sp.]HVV08140.1 ABC transporter ATP-binding protein [Amycolatopsis sp.]